MGTLKGKNLRVMVIPSNAPADPQCVALATNCTITLSTNTEDAATKEETGISSRPVVTSKSWQVSVDSMNVTDMGTLLTAIKNQQLFKLMWDETSTTDNQTAVGAAFARGGLAYLNDATFQFDDRTFSTKSIQFTGYGALAAIVDTPSSTEPPTGAAMTKGQYIRLFLSSDGTAAATKVIAAAKTLSFHTSLSLEDSTTKDTTGDWVIQEPTTLTFDISTSALVRSGETVTSLVDGQTLNDLETIHDNAVPVNFKIANVSGANNRTAGAVIVSGKALLSSLTINGPVKQNADYTAQLNGYGEYTVGS